MLIDEAATPSRADVDRRGRHSDPMSDDSVDNPCHPMSDDVTNPCYLPSSVLTDVYLDVDEDEKS